MTPLALRTRTLSGARPLGGLARHLTERGRAVSWLDSSRDRSPRGRVSVLAEVGPTAFALGRSCRRADAASHLVGRLRQAFERDRRQRRPYAVGEGVFMGGWIGYLAYEAQIDFDPAFPERDATLGYPRLWFTTAERGVTVDRAGSRTHLWEWCDEAAPSRLDEWAAILLAGEHCDPADDSGWHLEVERLARDWHVDAVESIVERIRAGEVYQVNLTVPVPVTSGSDPLGLYVRLRRASPSDYSAFLRWPGLTVLASSPEQFLSLRGGRVVSRPMKGTRPRGVDSGEDARLRRELLESEKDRAENLMIVDLVRNDLSRVAEVGSVSVERLFDVEVYATVLQMTSAVSCRLQPREDIFSLLAAVFPPGSMTGAPKFQATRVIRSLEAAPRGLYSGCLGAISWNGDADFNVVIRTLVSHPTGASWAVGGGVVADSDGLEEWREAETKLGALRRALDRS